jgi:hypothetical protein
MSLADLIERAVAVYGGNQADLARAIRRSPSVVGHWRIARYTPDFESCLALAQITGDSPLEVLRLAGHDPDRLVEAARRLQAGVQPEPEPDDPTDRKIRRRFRQFGEVVGRYPRAVQLAVIDANIRLAEAFGEATLEPTINSPRGPTVSSSDQLPTAGKQTSSRRLTRSSAWARHDLYRAA